MKTSYETESQPFPNQVAQLKGVITAMESSKFWQIRNAWFRLKQNLGLGKDNFHQIRSIVTPSSDALIADLAPTSPPPEPIKAPIAKAAKSIPRSLNSLTRENIADLYLQGQGIEIGALHHPLVVPKDAKVLYVDRMSLPISESSIQNLMIFP